MKTFNAFVCSALLALGFAAPAMANPFTDKLTVKFGVAGVLPDEEATISAIGGTVDISDEYLPALTLDYALTDNISVQAICCVAPHKVKAVQTAIGTVDLGEITLFPPTITGVYHFAPDAAFNPYVGAGVNVTVFFNEDLPAGPVTGIDYETTVGPAIQAGFDVKLNDKWSLNVDVKKIWVEPEVNLTTALGPVRADVKINPIVAFVGLGYKF
jgi:outer membrane protein